jgi:hypothetical protein
VYFNHVETEFFAKCLNCGWLGQMKAPQVDDHIDMEVVREMPKRIDKCKGCGRKAEIQGRGKCGTCYHAELRAEKASKEAVLEKVVAEPVAEFLVLDETPPCAACGLKSPYTPLNEYRECPRCGLNYDTGKAFQFPEVNLAPPSDSVKRQVVNEFLGRPSGLDALLNHPENHQLLLDLPNDVFQSLADHQITAADIIELLRDLVNLRLRRVAA